jgi:hypothetical protein
LDSSRRSHLKRLALYGAGVLTPPVLWRDTKLPPPPDSGAKPERVEEHWFTGGKPLFSRTPLNKLIREKPEIVFLGDSMVKAWIDPAVLSDLSGRRVSTLWQPNSTSSRWYLMFKNYVIRSQVRPRRVVFLFRNAFWHLPAYKVSGPFWQDIERCMPEMTDPVVSRILGDHHRRDQGRIGRFISEDAYPVQQRQDQAANLLEAAAANLIGRDIDDLRPLVNDRLGFTRFRQNLSLETGYHSGLQEAPFTRDPAKTFLPHVIDLARREGVEIFMLRVKRRPVSGADSPDSPGMARYIADLRACFERERVPFFDFTPDPLITESMYAEGDHLDLAHTAWFSKHLHQVLGKEIFKE